MQRNIDWQRCHIGARFTNGMPRGYMTFAKGGYGGCFIYDPNGMLRGFLFAVVSTVIVRTLSAEQVQVHVLCISL